MALLYARSGAIDCVVMLQEIKDANALLKRELIVHLFLAVLSTLAVLMFVYLFTFIFLYGDDYTFYRSLLIVVIVYVIAWVYLMRGYKQSWRNYDAPFDYTQGGGGSYMMGIYYNRVAGGAYFFNEIVFSAVSQILKAIDVAKRLMPESDQHVNNAAVTILSDLRDKGKNPRFHKIEETWDLCVLQRMLLNKLVWHKYHEDTGDLLVGINRRYDEPM